MQSTMYVKLAPGKTVADLRATLEAQYASEPFVKLLPKGVVPHTRHVRGSNFALMNVFEDRIAGRAIVISVIDNLVKGASGQVCLVWLLLSVWSCVLGRFRWGRENRAGVLPHSPTAPLTPRHPLT